MNQVVKSYEINQMYNLFHSCKQSTTSGPNQKTQPLSVLTRNKFQGVICPPRIPKVKFVAKVNIQFDFVSLHTYTFRSTILKN